MLWERLRTFFFVSVLVFQDMLQLLQGLPHSLLCLILKELQLLGRQCISFGLILQEMLG